MLSPQWEAQLRSWPGERAPGMGRFVAFLTLTIPFLPEGNHGFRMLSLSKV
jgi:hypothetical protein